MVLTLISVAFFLIVILFFTKEMTWLIVGEVDAFTLQNVQKYMLIVGAFTITYGISVVYRYTPPALGHSGTIALTGGMEAVLRLIGCVLVYKVGFLGACFLMPIGWVGRGIYDVAASYHYLRKEKQKYP